MFMFEPMKTEELFKLITSGPKWYAGLLNRNGSFHNAQSANRIKTRFKKGTLPEKTMEKLFKHFGYLKNEITWIKK